MKISKKEKIKLLEMMLTVRFFEEKARELYYNGSIRGTLHLSIGQEAVSSGACLTLNSKDFIVSNHRGHGHCIAKGSDEKKVLSEILGKESGCSGGRGGSMHIFDIASGVMGTNGIVGGGIPIATGVGLGIQLRKLDSVCLCFFGEGASNEGSFHEALNMAAIWDLPVVFICENNHFCDTTPYQDVIPIENISDRAVSFGIKGIRIDGNDVLEVYKQVTKAVEKARKGSGPTLIECKTYRWEGHHLGDPCVYRTKEEVKQWRKRCPILRYKKSLKEQGILTEGEIDVIDSKIKNKISDAEEFALASNSPEPDTVLEYVY
jgi:pyruvate dehydrogenase E1 component alpha subunit